MNAAPISYIPIPFHRPELATALPAPGCLPETVNHQFVEPLPGPMTPPTVAEIFTSEDVEIAINELRRVIGPRTANAMGIGRLAMRANIKPALMKAAVMHLHFFAEIRRRYSDDKETYLYFAAQRLKQAGPQQVIPERLMAFPMPHHPRFY